MNVVEFPSVDVGDVPRGLRELADAIEAGRYGDAHNLVWVCDTGDGVIECGLLGQAPNPASLGYFLLGLGMRKLEG